MLKVDPVTVPCIHSRGIDYLRWRVKVGRPVTVHGTWVERLGDVLMPHWCIISSYLF